MSFPSTNFEIEIVLPVSFLAALVLFLGARIRRMGRIADFALPQDVA